MSKRYLSGSLACVIMAAVSGCSEDTPERCIERFEKLLGDGRSIDGSDLRVGRFQPIFTYDVTHMEGVLEEFVGEDDELAGLRVTIAHGPSDAALRAFYEAEVPPKGAAFAADDFTLFRAHGAPGTREEALRAGCRRTPPEARLVHVQWNPVPEGTEDLARRQ